MMLNACPAHREWNLNEGSAASAMGLLAGLIVLALQNVISPTVVQEMLAFDAASFFA